MKAVDTKDEGKPVVGQASSDIPALKPYWGKPAVRNFRGGDGNVGIIRSPVRAIALPDYRKGSSESILASNLAGDTVRCFLKRRPEASVGGAIELRHVQRERLICSVGGKPTEAKVRTS